jgi:ABC-2 type transport system ATP-binding protein
MARLRLGSRRVRLIAAAAVVLALAVGLGGWALRPQPPGYEASSRTIAVRTGPGGAETVPLDTTYYRPEDATAAASVPAVLLAHGFGGTKDSVASDAEDLAGRGYAVLAYTAQGFGRSGGQIHLDSPDWEVSDAARLVDWLAARPEVRRDRAGDPRVGAVGGSYGGALALLLAERDHRVDAIVPQITWNDLPGALLPDATGAGPGGGVFKKGWAGVLFGEGGLGPRDPSCGRFALDVCRVYQSVATTGRATPDQIALLRRSSPGPLLGQVRAPTLLVQGEGDSLFPLAEADANARGIAAAGTPVRVAWYTGGHDGGRGPQSDQDLVRALTGQWLDHYLLERGPAPGTGFVYSRVAGIDAGTRGVVSEAYAAGAYPGLGGRSAAMVAVSGPPQPVAVPAGGSPAAISSLPGTGLGAAGAGAREVPGQHADFVSSPLTSMLEVVGAPSVQVRAASPSGEAVLLVKLYDLDPKRGPTLPAGLVAPVRLTGLPASIAAARPVTVTLPAIVHEFAAGHRLLVTVATSDQAYATPGTPSVDVVSAGGGVRLPAVPGTPIERPDVIWRWVLGAVAGTLALALVAAVVIGRRRRWGGGDVGAGDAGEGVVPLVVRGLRKEFPGGLVAVDGMDFEAGRGQVVGLLGPNGAGKTTALRMLMGLIRPSAGAIRIFGRRLVPGAPALSRLGALVEGPGFLPHLSGAANLRLHWRATGRPHGDARLDEVLAIAGLGDAVERRVGTYSHGMKQRLAIAQAMLGMPELLVLDEPTDGLDPPQIAEMRRVLRRYATGGRAVLVSSHLLAEVEQTCTHVVVVHHGRVVAAGPVAEVVGDSGSVLLDVSDVARAAEVLRRVGVAAVAGAGQGTLVADLDGAGRAAAVAALVEAGVGVSRVAPRRRLEDVFLALVGDGARE